MKDFIQMLEDAFPVLKSHPRIVLVIFVLLILLFAAYRAKALRARICRPLLSKLCHREFVTTRWLYVYRDSNDVDTWRYYASETTGGKYGDDIIWTLVRWPSLKPMDSFRIHGAVGSDAALRDSCAKLLGRWNIVHDPDLRTVGPVPALGIKSKLRRASTKVVKVVGSL